MAYLYEALGRILESSTNMMEMVWRHNNRLIVADLMMGIQDGSWIARYYAVRNVFIFFANLELQDLVEEVRPEVVEMLIDIVSDGRESCVNDFIECFERTYECAKANGFEWRFLGFLSEIHAVERLESVLEDIGGFPPLVAMVEDLKMALDSG
jgi:hypothetical protein